MLVFLFSCKKDEEFKIEKIIIEYHESKNDYSTVVNIDFNSSAIYLFKIYYTQNIIPKDPEDYFKKNDITNKNEEIFDEGLKRINLTEQEINALLDLIKSFEQDDYESKKGTDFIDGGFVKYHLVYKEKVVDIKRINNSSNKQVQLNNLVFDIIKKSNLD